mmetsp:Transcript_44299/g.137436  ORF Transcript_44299/g.137436 Transcript_44299/m.137436 type:complete len:368 (-) Transcript_44299:475-1578(-)
MGPMRRGRQLLHGLFALLQRLLRAPGTRSHADVRHCPDELLAPLKGVRLQRQGVAVYCAAVPKHEIARLGAHQPWAPTTIRDDVVIHLQLDEVPLRRLVPPQHLRVEAVRARHHDEAAARLRGVCERDEALDAVQARLQVRLVHVVPVLPRRLPAGLTAEGPEDTGSVEGRHQRICAPDGLEDLAQLGQAPEVPEQLGLADAPGVDDAVLLAGRPAAEGRAGVLPGAHVVAPDPAGPVAGFDEVPQQGVCLLPLLRRGDSGDDYEALLGEVLLPAHDIAEGEAPAVDDADVRRLPLGVVRWVLEAQQVLDLPREPFEPIVEVEEVCGLQTHLRDTLMRALEAKLGHDLALHGQRQVSKHPASGLRVQ